MDVQDNTEGPNGLPSIVGDLTITGAGADLTTIEQNPDSLPSFRLAHVAATGTLTLNGLTLQHFSPTLDFLLVFPGGALYNRGTLTLTDVAVLGNYARGGDDDFGGGGGVYNEGTLMLTNTIVADNGGHYDGGGLFNAGGTVRISQSTIARSASGLHGDGICNTQGGSLTLTNSAVIDNVAFGTAGLANLGGRMALTNSTFAGNAGNFGTGAISGGATLVNTTIAENSASYSGGLSGIFVLVNTILARNVGFDVGFGGGSDCGGTITSQGNNLIGDLTGCTVTWQSTDLVGEPGLGPFTDDETPGDAHYPLLQGSQAMNAGNPAVCPKTDQLGKKRVGICDIGAVEFQGTAVSSR